MAEDVPDRGGVSVLDTSAYLLRVSRSEPAQCCAGCIKLFVFLSDEAKLKIEPGLFISLAGNLLYVPVSVLPA